MPAMLNEIVTDLINEQDDMETSCVDGDADLVEQKISTWHPDVLLLACAADAVGQTAMPYLQVQPRLRVVALTDSGRDAVLCELKLNKTHYDSISHDSLIETIRGITRH
jgi:chemotaxis response regulator CheB